MEHDPPDLNSIYNLLVLSDDLVTAGQPDEDEIRAVAQSGFHVVINLGLAEAEYALADERALVQSLGMDYAHIPVRWENPTKEDLGAFFQIMDGREHKRVFVHCAANKRVSIFMALYRMVRLGWSEADVLQDVERIWRPEPRWRDFFQKYKRGF